ncbi:hypothetical protein GO009_05980 [Muricauda sp. TY007]|uniref:tetratricopeptide repeat protein n=1 Tax=Allomuricauda sp. TY007 TaxID=2683200 RepID=UPI0013C1DC28|nr:hypothetical protein [Muricauda sp. TY007]NDV15570.1 hypothetical protein [Muricauda sp. TY007]
MKRTMLLLMAGILSSCINNSNSSELEKLKTENKKLTVMVDSLLKTPENRYNKAYGLLEQNNDSLALSELKQLVQYYPKSDYAEKAVDEISRIEAEQKKQKEEEERIKRLGFKAVKAATKIKYDYLTLNFTDIQFRENFVFDSYDDRYHYRSAERGSKYLVVRVSITSEVNNASLPRILAYALKDGELISITPLGLRYEFRRWEDYGSYLGNNADYGNDFAQISTIGFNLGSQISESEFKGFPIYVVMQKTKAFHRNEGRFDNPPVSYKADDHNYKNILTLQDFSDTGDYLLVKRL